MDSAIWAIWYDLAEETAGEYLDWLHGDYLPGLLKRPGYAWAAHYKNAHGGEAMQRLRQLNDNNTDPSVGTGTQYVMMVGATSALTFLSPSVVDLEAAETGRNRAMIDRRVSPQTFLFSEVFRVNGPSHGARTPGTGPAPSIQMGTLRMKAIEGEHVIGKWYAETRLPEIARMPGAVGIRVMACIMGWSKYGVLYEFESAEARTKGFEPIETKGIMDGTRNSPLKGRHVHAVGSPLVANRIWPPVGA